MRLIKKGIAFEWDDNKARTNLIEHGITFEQASDVFFDPYLRIVDATDMTKDEERDGVIGYSEDGQLLFVVSVERCDDEIRIISAREATLSDRRVYES